MFKNYFTTFSIIALTSLFSCQKVFEKENYVAYFGGEIINPQNKYVLFLKDNTIIDTLKLDKKNRFFHKFDSLAPGLYTFVHQPEYQYIYFDKNDSLMIRLNTEDFDNTLAFCGRGDEKNNFLIDLFLKNEEETDKIYDIYQNDLNSYSKFIDSGYRKLNSFYEKRKEEIKWDENFDQFAKASIDYNYYYKKEIYPYAHEYKTGENVCPKLPKEFYSYRRSLNLDNDNLADYSPFLKYISTLLNNLTYEKGKCKKSQTLDSYIAKLNIADTLIKNIKIKNNILNNIANSYLLEDQNLFNNKQFIDRYVELTNDTKKKNEIIEISNAIQNLKEGNSLPEIKLIDKQKKTINLKDVIENKKCIIFFWTTHAKSHALLAHDKIKNLQKKYPEIKFIAININDTNENWTNALEKYNFEMATELKAVDFNEIKKKWVITKNQRTIILNKNGQIKNAFSNLFDATFEKNIE